MREGRRERGGREGEVRGSWVDSACSFLPAGMKIYPVAPFSIRHNFCFLFFGNLNTLKICQSPFSISNILEFNSS